MTLPPSAAYVVPAASVVPMAVIYAFGDAATGFGWAIFGVILLALVEWTISRRLTTHLAAMTQIVERAAVTADSLDAQHRADKDRSARLASRIDRLDGMIEDIAARCATVHDR